MKRYYIVFEGMVQGVGFRWTLYHQANALGLAGWVRNRGDGRVEAEIQGDEGLIRDLIRSLNEDCYIRIDDYSIKEIELAENAERFIVTY